MPFINGMESSRSPAIASRENRDYQRATGRVYRASFSTGGYRRLAPRIYTGLDLTANDTDSGLWISMARIVLREIQLTDFNLMGRIRWPIQRLANLSGQIIE